MADDARAPCACRRLEIIGSAYAVWRWSRRGTEVRLYGETHKQLRDESRSDWNFSSGWVRRSRRWHQFEHCQ